MACPICKKALATDRKDAPFRPFCSERCRTIDLGAWLGEGYKISRPLIDEDLPANGSGSDQDD